MPNPGRIRIYTSGCPKNQNKCWNRIGSPPPAGSKKVVFRFRSVRSIVMAPANTGRDITNRNAVMATDHTNRGIRSNEQALCRILIIVERKLIEERIDEMPARWREKMARSTDGPAWAIFLESGG